MKFDNESSSCDMALIYDSLTAAQIDPVGAGDWYSVHDYLTWTDFGQAEIDDVVAIAEARILARAAEQTDPLHRNRVTRDLVGGRCHLALGGVTVAVNLPLRSTALTLKGAGVTVGYIDSCRVLHDWIERTTSIMNEPKTPLPVHQWGAITVWPNHVTTPHGTYPLADTRWSATQSWELQRGTPWWAMILGFATAFTVIGIAFFFVRTTRQWGVVTVDMHSTTGGWWSDTLRVDAPFERNRIISDVAHLDYWATNVRPSTQSRHGRRWGVPMVDAAS